MSLLYKYREDVLIQEIKDYIDSTYSGHYAGGRVQPGELIMAMGLGQQYFIGNILKYAARYGKKNGYNRKDLMKVIHYAIMTLADADQTTEDKRKTGDNQ